MIARSRWSRWVSVVGSIAMLVGAIDPLEGSLVILPGCALVALGAWAEGGDRRLLAYRVWTFVLVAVGVGSLWALSAAGGIGGAHGLSPWLGLLLLPYVVGWLMAVWAPARARWFHIAAVVVGSWYLAIPVLLLLRRGQANGAGSGAGSAPAVIIGVTGLLAIVGSVRALVRRARPAASAA